MRRPMLQSYTRMSRLGAVELARSEGLEPRPSDP